MQFSLTLLTDTSRSAQADVGSQRYAVSGYSITYSAVTGCFRTSAQQAQETYFVQISCANSALEKAGHQSVVISESVTCYYFTSNVHS